MELEKNLIQLGKKVDTKKQAIDQAGKLLVNGNCVDSGYIHSMELREQDVSTYMGNFIAIPHGTNDGKKYIKKTGISILQVPRGVRFGKNDNAPNIVTVVFGIAGLKNEHLKILQQIALYCNQVSNVAKLADAQSKEEIIDLLKGV